MCKNFMKSVIAGELFATISIYMINGIDFSIINKFIDNLW
ncbi:putative membrane protein [Candidatus Neoehrlichia lotoris str. RAC413]|uniref:Putative membrane protein n=1 Tax=Candidatus Neoehrlichia procyonis str. RAC413 TaxID=1359163 RepID=A0A0F3NNP7_9RICK|nr:putative membrane protein [Candidatus Neoehrlichia lotoris str. RAC413]